MDEKCRSKIVLGSSLQCWLKVVCDDYLFQARKRKKDHHNPNMEMTITIIRNDNNSNQNDNSIQLVRDVLIQYITSLGQRTYTRQQIVNLVWQCNDKRTLSLSYSSSATSIFINMFFLHHLYHQSRTFITLTGLRIFRSEVDGVS
jgi:hypothetical protein